MTSEAPETETVRNPWLAAGLLLAGLLSIFLLMSNAYQVRFGVAFGALGLVTALAGLFEALGILRTRDDSLPKLLDVWLTRGEHEPAWVAPRITAPVAFVVFVIAALVLGPAHAHWAVLLALLTLLPASLTRPPLFVFVASAYVLLPLLGQYSLSDPWETHYGEVAREILARDDWITLWWAQDGWFMSKPIWIFWVEALLWNAFGLPFAPDSNPAHPEWVLRLPVYLLSTGALLAVYTAISRLFNKRAGVLSALVLCTMPYFGFLAHQAITDMHFVANMTIALCLLMLALQTEPDAQVPVYRLGPLRISTQHLVMGAIVAVALPQAMYLLTRNFTMVEFMRFWPHLDRFEYGSAGNAGLPGNAAARAMQPHLRELWFQPFAQGVYGLLGLGALVWMLRKERGRQALLMFGFYLFCTFAFMAKGIPGFGLPGLVAALYLLTTGRMNLLPTGRLRIGAGALVILVCGMPWFVAKYARLGPLFTDRLLIHDHINRLAAGVHGDNGTIQYFIWQLGYGAFPWIALAPAALTAWLYMRTKPAGEGRDVQRHTLILVALWCASAFTLFSAMVTKFHHYIFPAVPPMAILVGIWLDRALGRPPLNEAAAGSDRPPHERRVLALLLCCLAPVCWIAGFGGWFGNLRGVVPEGLEMDQAPVWIAEHGLPGWACGLLLVAGAALMFAGTRLLAERIDEKRTPVDIATGVSLAAGLCLLAFAARDLSWVTSERPAGYERLIHLFVYNYGRPFPDYLNYRPILAGFGLTFSVLLGLGLWRKLRTGALTALLAGAWLLAAWNLNVYLIDLSPHWGQRELFKRYYAERSGPEEPIIAWQMNWKGENLYSGNRVYVFVKLDNKEIRDWLKENEGTTAYFVLEHTRMKNFKRLVGRREVEELTTLRENNKFVLARVEI